MVKILNTDTINQLIEDIGKEGLSNVLEIFKIEMIDYRRILKEEQNTFLSIQNLMHKIKGSAISLGAEKLSIISIEIELAAKNKEHDIFNKIADLYIILDDTFNECNNFSLK